MLELVVALPGLEHFDGVVPAARLVDAGHVASTEHANVLAPTLESVDEAHVEQCSMKHYVWA